MTDVYERIASSGPPRRCNLRYGSRITLPGDNIDLAEYLNALPAIPFTDGSITAFNSSVTLRRPDDPTRLRYAIRSLPSEASSATFNLQIDANRLGEPMAAWDSLPEWLDESHARIEFRIPRIVHTAGAGRAIRLRGEFAMTMIISQQDRAFPQLAGQLDEPSAELDSAEEHAEPEGTEPASSHASHRNDPSWKIDDDWFAGLLAATRPHSAQQPATKRQPYQPNKSAANHIADETQTSLANAMASREDQPNALLNLLRTIHVCSTDYQQPSESSSRFRHTGHDSHRAANRP